MCVHAHACACTNFPCSGRVIGPTFQFDVSEIKFGLVSCGAFIIACIKSSDEYFIVRLCEHS